MVDITPLWSFVAISVVIIVAPGADLMLLIRTSLAGGHRAGFATFAGIHVGNIVLTTLVSSGLGLLVARNHTAMLLVQVAGGLYLLWLAAGAMRAMARMRATRKEAAHESGEALAVGSRQAFVQGLVSNLTNPKLLVFYLSFFPQFLGHASSSFAQLELLAGVFIALAMLWQAVVILAAARMQHLMDRPWFATGLECLSIVVFVGLAAVILFEAAAGS